QAPFAYAKKSSPGFTSFLPAVMSRPKSPMAALGAGAVAWLTAGAGAGDTGFFSSAAWEAQAGRANRAAAPITAFIGFADLTKNRKARIIRQRAPGGGPRASKCFDWSSRCLASSAKSLAWARLPVAYHLSGGRARCGRSAGSGLGPEVQEADDRVPGLQSQRRLHLRIVGGTAGLPHRVEAECHRAQHHRVRGPPSRQYP